MECSVRDPLSDGRVEFHYIRSNSNSTVTEEDLETSDASQVLGVNIQSCVQHTKEGLWTYDSVGPFTTNGGDAWMWSYIGVGNVQNDSSILDDLARANQIIGVVKIGGQVQDYNAIPIQRPPLQVHHAHFTNDYYATKSMTRMFDAHFVCSHPQALPVPNPADITCLQEYESMAKLARLPIFTDGLIFDVRPLQSSKLVWQLKVAMYIIILHTSTMQNVESKQHFAPLSVQKIYNPGLLQGYPFGDLYAFHTLSEDCFMFFSGYWPAPGRLLNFSAMFHSHPNSHVASFLVNEHPSQLNLMLSSDLSPCEARATRTTLWYFNSNLMKFIQRNHNDKMICEAIQLMPIRGMPTRSLHCNDQHLDENTIFTSLTIFNAAPYAGSWQHVVWSLEYLSDDLRSRYAERHYHADPDYLTNGPRFANSHAEQREDAAVFNGRPVHHVCLPAWEPTFFDHLQRAVLEFPVDDTSFPSFGQFSILRSRLLMLTTATMIFVPLKRGKFTIIRAAILLILLSCILLLYYHFISLPWLNTDSPYPTYPSLPPNTMFGDMNYPVHYMLCYSSVVLISTCVMEFSQPELSQKVILHRELV